MSPELAAQIQLIIDRLATTEGTFALSCHLNQWSVAIEWGHEADDSPMVGAAAYGLGTTAEAAIQMAVEETGWSICADCRRNTRTDDS